ncbi:MAG: hypothetical protein LAT83_10015, partial [Kiritimatiellae bacterium]|nr:hypothetical protein [Kiritimatiellia bacterium]
MHLLIYDYQIMAIKKCGGVMPFFLSICSGGESEGVSSRWFMGAAHLAPGTLQPDLSHHFPKAQIQQKRASLPCRRQSRWMSFICSEDPGAGCAAP